MTATIRGTIRGMARRANPAFATGAVAIPLAALLYRLNRPSASGLDPEGEGRTLG